MHMARNDSVKEPSNPSLKNSSNDHFYDPLQYHSLNSSKDHSNVQLNDSFKDELVNALNDNLNDPLNEKLNLDLDVPLNDPLKDHLNDLWTQQLSSSSSENLNDQQLSNPLNKDLNVQLNEPLQKPLNDPLNNFLSLPLYLEQEDVDEFSDDMALHESPVVRPPPPNTPTTQSMQESPTNSTNLAPHAIMEDDDNLDSDEFEDSIDIQSMNLHGSLADCEKAITLFFNNRLDSAIAIMTPWKETSLYHAHGATIFEFIPAVLTLEPEQIQRAQDALRHTFTLCTQIRKSYTFVQSIGAIIKKPNYGGYTEEEAHAELVHAEALLLLACLGIIENEDMTGFLRASLRVKASFNGYRICAKILAKKTWENESSRAHFDSGVRLGLATFNVMIAMLPSRIVTLLQFVGFSADKEKGIAELLKASQAPGLRSVLCDLTLLVYYLIIGHFAAITPDFSAAEKILSKSLKKYPNSVWFLMFKARMQLLRGKALDSIETYQKTCKTKDLWPQLKHLAYWELVWAFAMMRQWTHAAEYAAILEHDSKWSRTIYMYAQAAMLIENGPQSPSERNCIDALLTNASCYRQRLLGRSLPMEKFVLRRCERWAKRGCLVLPGVEWLYLWNIFPSLAADRDLSDSILKIIEKAGAKIKISLDKKKRTEAEQACDAPDANDFDQDDLALVELLQGSLLCAMGLPRLALQNLENVIEMKDDIKENTFSLPYATVEIATCYYELGDPKRALDLLQDARKKYSGYLLEARLHFRIHSKLEFIHAGISLMQKPTGTITVTSVASKWKPKMQTSMKDDGLSSSARMPPASNSKKNAGSNLFSSVNGTESSESTSAVPGPSSTTNTTSLDLLSSTNSMPEIEKTSACAEPMPSTSSDYRPSSSTKLNITADIEPSKPSTSATKPENFNSARKGIPERRSVKKDVPSMSFEMDLITSADAEPTATENGVAAPEADTRKKGRT